MDQPEDLLASATSAAWLDYCNGTYSTTDERIFKEAFVKGWMGKCYHLRVKGESDASLSNQAQEVYSKRS